MRIANLDFNILWAWKYKFEISKTEYNARTAFVFWIFAFDIRRKVDSDFFRLKPTKSKNFITGFEVKVTKITR